MQGYFISFEGPDGAGKSTALHRLLPELGSKLRQPYFLTREPGGSEIAEQIRQLILNPRNKKMTARTEALLYAAARSQHVEEVVRPALQKGRVVLSDRFVDSSLAYQGAGRGLGIQAVKQINTFATKGLVPNLTLFFALAPANGLARIAKTRPHHEDRLEQEQLAFHQRVYSGYQKVNQAAGQRVVTIDASQSIAIVSQTALKVILQHLPKTYLKAD